jgi:hypothetical protein
VADLQDIVGILGMVVCWNDEVENVPTTATWNVQLKIDLGVNGAKEDWRKVDNHQMPPYGVLVANAEDEMADAKNHALTRLTLFSEVGSALLTCGGNHQDPWVLRRGQSDYRAQEQSGGCHASECALGKRGQIP